jgi:hypothetical protein
MVVLSMPASASHRLKVESVSRSGKPLAKPIAKTMSTRRRR